MAACRDNYHLGHMVLEKLRERPDEICQIDAGTGESETNASVLSRAVRLARCLRRLGAAPGDLLALHGNNHLDLLVPFYAALFNGMTLAGADPKYDYEEMKYFLMLTKPKVLFSDSELFHEAVTKLGLDTKIITFKDGEQSMRNYMDEYANENDIEAEFRVAEYDVEKVPIWLISTSGTTGVPKLTTQSHKLWMQEIQKRQTVLAKMIKIDHNLPALTLSPVQWISAYISAVIMPLSHFSIVRSSTPPSVAHVIDIINEYKPVHGIFLPNTITAILNHEKECDLTCFYYIGIAGMKMNRENLDALKKRMRKNAIAADLYGVTEALGEVLETTNDTPFGSVGKPAQHQLKIVDQETGLEITEPYKRGELLIKGPMCDGYYNDPEQTAEAFTEDGWYITGDLFYKDENNYYYFVERIGQLIRNRNYFVAPWDLMEVIRKHPGVVDVCVTGVPSLTDGEAAVACVVRRPEYIVTAQDIKDFVASKVEPFQQLRGGVIFMDALPRTSTGKLALAKIRQIALVAHRE